MTSVSSSHLEQYIEQAQSDASHAFAFLRESRTLSASLTFFITHRAVEYGKVLSFRFPSPWSREQGVSVKVSELSQEQPSILDEARLNADTLIHAHTPYLAAWSLAHKPFPILTSRRSATCSRARSRCTWNASAACWT